jgi:hypothetical protein
VADGDTDGFTRDRGFELAAAARGGAGGHILPTRANLAGEFSGTKIAGPSASANEQ